MSDTTQLEAKVLLLDHDPAQYRPLSEFCRSVGLMPLLRSAHDALATLAQHKDLAGVLLAQDLPVDDGTAFNLAQRIHRQRPELPIVLRRSDSRALNDEEQASVQYEWQSGDMDALRGIVDKSIFIVRYPAELVEGIVALTQEALLAMFPNAEVQADPPYVVHDRIIYGEVSTLIPIESTWCRGFMMLQTEESALRQGVLQGMSMEGIGGDLSFREINNLLGECTNLIWGAFKNRYIPPQAFANQQTQVPIVINHAHKYISFGTTDPQLCVRYRLSDQQRKSAEPLWIVQRFIFNLLWSPDQYTEFMRTSPQGGSTGVLELF
ncbi:chemotaxis protein CheX [Roseateles sp. BYS180W]|uniref:Chemotaxis protein CheX n=1 Tax=Roseateles rivi TaxID=3299028 RepID=A0ABW7FR19_9BURK